MVEAAVAEFESILEDKQSEARLHEFLSSHTYFFNGAFRVDGYSPAYSKVKLGCNYEVDFAWFDTSSFGPEWFLVEIEAPAARLYTKGGNPSAALTHAVQQVRDWHSWLHENLDYARKLMPGIEYPLCLVFMGRRSELNPETKAKLRRYQYENRPLLRLHTLDWLANAGKSVTTFLRSGAAPLPTQALSHKELAAGLPETARNWIDYHASHPQSVWWKGVRKQGREDACFQMTEFDSQ